MKEKAARPDNFIKFLGTAGARFVMIRQLRHSGGLWVSSAGTNVLIDPGPGSIVHCAKSRPKLDPAALDAIILTHRHLDHCSDVNVMIEAMTEGGFKKKGVVFCPQDALEGDPVIFRYLRGFVEKIEVLSAGRTFAVGNFRFETSMRHVHPVETYGLKFKIGGRTTVGLLADTKYFKALEDFYRVDTLIIGVVFYEPRPNIDHLGFDDARALIAALRPRRAVLLTLAWACSRPSRIFWPKSFP
ncbi:MAG: MBL fold metallo-hydrolase, partial [Candidatus Omnitrophica bacterium]|nr:MBL fold metallo-hydrolase [Candidatus Omnitrophota bacterium]